MSRRSGKTSPSPAGRTSAANDGPSSSKLVTRRQSGAGSSSNPGGVRSPNAADGVSTGKPVKKLAGHGPSNPRSESKGGDRAATVGRGLRSRSPLNDAQAGRDPVRKRFEGVVEVPSVGPTCTKPPRQDPSEAESPALVASETQEDQVLEVGSYTMTGKKLSDPGWENQDRLLVKELPNSKVLVAVFDGHGEFGHRIAEFTCQTFERLSPLLFAGVAPGGAPSALMKMFSQSQALLECDPRSRSSGTTAVCAVIDSVARTVTVAHVGDSRAVLAGSDGSVAFETQDHKWDPRSEIRVCNRGGEIRNEHGCRRIFARDEPWPGLAMSRSLGDVAGNQLGVTAEPEISAPMPFGAFGDSALVLGTDGLWDMVPAKFATERSLSAGGVESLAQFLVAEARARWPPTTDIDDVTAVVVRLMSSAEEEQT